MSSFSKVLVITVCLGLVAADYCNSNLCPNNEKHIACESSGAFDASCPKDAQLEELSSDHIKQILHLHNKLRNQTASGGLKGFKSATRMATMTWNSELAKFAELNVKQCKLQHDKCRSTSAYKFAGQNIGFQAQSGEFEPLKGALEKVLAGWFDEHKDASQSDIDKCCTSKSGKVIGHFTQLVRDRAIQVGCAVSRFTQENVWKSSLVTCNYAITNLVDNPVYESGTAASGCTTGPNPDYFALCSVNEPIKVVPV